MARPDHYQQLLRSRAVPWGRGPKPPIGIGACIAHLCSVIIVNCQRGKGDGEVITERQAIAFFPKVG